MNETVRYQFSPRQNHTHESKTNHCWCLSMASGVKRFFFFTDLQNMSVVSSVDTHTKK